MFRTFPIIFVLVIYLFLVPLAVFSDSTVATESYSNSSVYSSQYESSSFDDKSVSRRVIDIVLEHGLTGVVLLILAWWYSKRQTQWDIESKQMRQELLDYVKADQASDYEMMTRIDKLTTEIHDLRSELKYLKS